MRDHLNEQLEHLAGEDGTISSSPPKQAIARVRYTHDAMIDRLLADPCISQNELAEAFGYSASWISQIMSSDAFQARFAARRAELVDPVVAERCRINFEAMVLRSQEILMEKLSRPAGDIPDSLVLKSFELSTRAAGYGIRGATAPAVNVDVHLDVLQQNITRMLRAQREALAGEEQKSED